LAGCSVLAACTGTTVVHRAVSQAPTAEHFSISSIDVRYATALRPEEEAIAAEYDVGERLAEKIQGWTKETGMWGGAQCLAIEVDSILLRNRFRNGYLEGWDADAPQPVQDRLGIQVEILQGDRVLHRMDVVREKGLGDDHWDTIYSTDRAMDDLIAEAAWQVVYELTPTGFDEAIVRIGHRDGVQPATVIASERGLLGSGQMLKGAATNEFGVGDLDDAYCGASLSKPSWIPWWLWDPVTYQSCKARAEEAAKRE
jgi:hypothetical protein